jgi:hypothetical protein
MDAIWQPMNVETWRGALEEDAAPTDMSIEAAHFHATTYPD